MVFCPWSCWLFFQVSGFDASQVSRLDVQRFGDLTKPWHRFNVLAFCRWNWRPAVQFLPGLFVGETGGTTYVQQLCFFNVDVSNFSNEENGYQQDIQQIWIQLEFDRQHHWLFGWKCHSRKQIFDGWIEMCHGMCQDSWKSVNLRIRNACSSVHMRKWWMVWLSCQKRAKNESFMDRKWWENIAKSQEWRKNTNTQCIWRGGILVWRNCQICSLPPCCCTLQLFFRSKVGFPKRKVVSQLSFFRDYVSFRQCTQKERIRSSCVQIPSEICFRCDFGA